MSAPLRQTALRRLRAAVSPVFQQRRHARVLNVRFVQTQQNVAEKYQALLERKAKSEGMQSIEQLKEAYKTRIDQYKQDSLAPPVLPGALSHATTPSPILSETLDAAPPIQPQSSAASITQPPPPPPKIPKPASAQKTLASFVDVSKILLHDAKEIEYIWRARHLADKNSLCAVIPLATYRRLEATARKHPIFILPLPREGQGVELHFLQWQFTSPTASNIMFTSLIEYKMRGEYASPHTTVTHHLEISEEKGVVLLQGSVVENKGVSVEEAKWLLMTLQKFYGAEEAGEGVDAEASRRRRELLKLFCEGKPEFDVQLLIKEAEAIS